MPSYLKDVAPARERGLKSYDMPLVQGADIVAPARERGLKYVVSKARRVQQASLPRRSVD